jgi:hypothetical protein
MFRVSSARVVQLQAFGITQRSHAAGKATALFDFRSPFDLRRLFPATFAFWLLLTLAFPFMELH